MVDLMTAFSRSNGQSLALVLRFVSARGARNRFIQRIGLICFWVSFLAILFTWTIANGQDCISYANSTTTPVVDSFSPLMPSVTVIDNLMFGFLNVPGGTHSYPPRSYLRIYDISDLAIQRELGTIDFGVRTSTAAFVVSGNYAYVATHRVDFTLWGMSNGVRLNVIDISNPETPVVVGSHTTSENEDVWPHKMVLRDDYVHHMSYEGRLTIYDVSLPDNPDLVGGTSLGIFGVYSFAVDGDYAYAGGEGIVVVDISDLSSPAFAGLMDVDFANFGYVHDIEIRDSHAYLYCTHANLVVDISTPTMPEIIGTWGHVNGHGRMELSGDIAYVANGSAGLAAFSLISPSQPELIGVHALDYTISDVVAGSDFLHLYGGGWVHFALRDCTDPVPTFLSFFEVDQAGGVLSVRWRAASGAVDGDFRLLAIGKGFEMLMPFESDWSNNCQASVPYSDFSDMDTLTIELQYRTIGGTWSTIASETVELDALPSATRILQISPNPFNPRLGVSFNVGATQLVEVAVHDLMGRKIALIAGGVFEPGEYDVSWDGADSRGLPVASGAYFVRMMSRNGVETTKVLLAR